MKRLLLACIILAIGITPCFSANSWRNEDADFQDGDATYFGAIDTDLSNYVIEPLDRILAAHRTGAIIKYATAETLTVGAGEVGTMNAAGTLQNKRRNTSATTVTWAVIDTGAEAVSTTYYVWAIADADATTFTVKVSLSSAAPASSTHYALLGSFYNNSAGNISYISNYNGTAYEEPAASDLSEGTSYSAGTTYQNTADHKLLIVWYGVSVGSGGWQNLNQYGQIGEASAGTTVARCEIVDNLDADKVQYCTGTFVVPQGWYWKVTNTTGHQSITGTMSKIEAWEFD